MKKKLVISGITGKCGKSLLSIINDYNSSNINDSFPSSSSFNSCNTCNFFEVIGGINSKTSHEDCEKLVQSSDIIIDFSTPKALENLLQIAVKYKKPVVSGTTGIENDELLRPFAKDIPIFYASNFSVAIFLMHNMLKQLDKILCNYDKVIIDLHHKHKRDLPSGTALFLSSALQNANIVSYKGGEVIGDHCAQFLGDFDMIEIRHRALKRELFTKGALDVAKWMLDLKEGVRCGLLGMNDYLIGHAEGAELRGGE